MCIWVMNEWRMEGKKITDCGMGISDCGKDMVRFANQFYISALRTLAYGPYREI